VTTRALRTVRKYGGIDAYLARRDDSILGAWGRSMRETLANVVYSRGFGDQLQAEAASRAAELDAEIEAIEAQKAAERLQPPGLPRAERGLNSPL
jgi:hypothetical protein